MEKGILSQSVFEGIYSAIKVLDAFKQRAFSYKSAWIGVKDSEGTYQDGRSILH